MLKRNQIVALAAALAIFAVPMLGKMPRPDTIQERVRHELASLPYLTLFDDLSFRVDGNTVTLFGEVVRPMLKNDAENAVKRVEGVMRVDNEIEILPLSPMDQQIRLREARAIFSYPPLSRYGMGVLPAIHIIVKNGNVTLKGVVGSDADRNLAYMRANGVPDVFSVTNELQVVK
ncbi:MAG TPA: BON domain-containing protein [Bryobacteraceae bacterium]|nr:BON domain-containing protein [Bryobacteraceae bacterium]